MKTKSNVSILSSIVLLSLCSCGQRNVTVHIDADQKSYDIVLKSGESLSSNDIFSRGWGAEVFYYDIHYFGPFYKDTYYPYHDGPVTEDINLILEGECLLGFTDVFYIVFPQLHWRDWFDCDTIKEYDQTIIKDLYLKESGQCLEKKAPGSTIKSFYWDYDASSSSFVDQVEPAQAKELVYWGNCYTLFCELDGLA